MDRSKVLIAIVISTLILVGWFPLMRYLNLTPAPPPPEVPPALISETPPPTPDAPNRGAPPVVTDKKPAPVATPAPPAPTTQVAPRDIKITTPTWAIKLSNRGAVATSWIITQHDGKRVTAASGNGKDEAPLEIIAQDTLETLGAPLRLRLPDAPILGDELNKVNYQVDGATENDIKLNAGEEREITFRYSSSAATVRKTFKFYADKLIFDATAEVISNNTPQRTELVFGPRIGDASNQQTGGTYGNHYQVIAYTPAGSRTAFDGSYITPAFARITQIDEAGKRIQLDKPLAGDVNQVRIVGGDGSNFITLVGFAAVVNREGGNQTLTLNAIPEGTQVGNAVAQGADTYRQPYAWVGTFDNYFGMLAIPPQPVSEISLTSAQLRNGEAQAAAHDYPSIAVPVDAKDPMRIYVGPKDRELLAALGNQYGTDLEAIIDYGMFAFIVRPIVKVLAPTIDALFKIFGNYGWAIVAITVIVNLLLFPLRYYSSKKMKQAAKHQPRIKELQEKMKKLKDSPKASQREMQELQREQMAIMKEANPMGGCLPMLLQMPVFWSFFVFLSISLDMRHAYWLGWVSDLSKPDPYLILPIVMCVTMIASTALMPAPKVDDPAMKMQRTMMIWVMPIMLTVFFFRTAPSGLVLYWMVSNIVGVGIQLVINKITAEPEPSPVVAPTKGKGGKSSQRRNAEAKS